MTYTPHFPNSPMPPPTFQCPADSVHCRVMLSPPTREECNNLSPDSLHSSLTLTSSLGGVRIQMGSRCAWARGKMQPWPVHFLPVPCLWFLLSAPQNSPILGPIASEPRSVLVYLLTMGNFLWLPVDGFITRVSAKDPSVREHPQDRTGPKEVTPTVDIEAKTLWE